MSDANNHLYLALAASGVLHGLLFWAYTVDQSAYVEMAQSSTVLQVELWSLPVTKPMQTPSVPVVVQQLARNMVTANKALEIEPQPPQQQQQAVQTTTFSYAENEQFVSLLHQAIDQRKRYPTLAQRQRREGLVKLQFVVHPNGQVTDVAVIESSQFDLLDAAALDAVNAISPFMLASTYIQEQRIYDMDIEFRLN